MFWLVGDHRLGGVDRRAFALLAVAPGGLLARIAAPAAEIGPPLLAVLVIAVIIVLIRQRARLDAAVVLCGFPVCAIGIHVAKAAVARARPSGSLIQAGGFAFPSGDSALCIGVIVITIALARLTSDRTWRAAWIAAGGLATIAGGLLFIALRVHYLSDVIGGWALGVTVFAACGLVLRRIAAWDRRQGP